MGGTPSRLAGPDIEAILQALHRAFDTGAVREITLELNPDDASVTYLRQLRTMGVNRLSIGIQSFFEDDLRFMNRSHSELQARQVVDEARRAGFEAISIDLIFGLPGQPMEYWGANLQRAQTMDVPHISTYSLTVEPGTVLAKQVSRGLVRPAPDEATAERYLFTMDYLESHGYQHYEISSLREVGWPLPAQFLLLESQQLPGFRPCRPLLLVVGSTRTPVGERSQSAGVRIVRRRWPDPPSISARTSRWTCWPTST